MDVEKMTTTTTKVRTSQRSRIRSRTITLSKVSNNNGNKEQHEIQVHVQQVRQKTTTVATPEVDRMKECLRLAMKERLWLERQLSFLTQSLQQVNANGDVDAVEKHVQLTKTNQTLSQHVEFLSSLVRQQHDVDKELKERQTKCKELESQLQTESVKCQQLSSKLEKAVEKNQELVAYSSEVQLQLLRLQQQVKDVADERKAFEKEHDQILGQLQQKREEVTSLKKVKECDRQRNNENIEVLQSQLRELEKKCELQKVKHEELVLEMDSLHRKQPRKDLDLSQTGNDYSISNGLQRTSLDNDFQFTDDYLYSRHELRPKNVSQITSSNVGSSMNPEAQTMTPRRSSPSPKPSEIPSEIDRIMAKLEQDNKILAELDRTRASIGLGTPVPAPRSIGAAETGMIGGYPRNHTTNIITSTTSNTSNTSLTTAPSSTQPKSIVTTSNATAALPSVTISTLSSEHEAGRISVKSHGESIFSHEDPNNFLNIPGIGNVLVYIARYTYDPFQMSPNENPEAELMVNAGDYVLVSSDMDEDGFFDGQLLDGRRGLVPSNFVEKLTGEDLLEFQQHLLMDESLMNDFCLDPTIEDQQRLIESCLPGDVICLSNLDNLEDADEFLMESNGDGPEIFFSTLVAPPHNLTLERQFRKSILISWAAPSTPLGSLDSFNVYVDGELRITVLATERTRALVEGVDSARPHRISVRSVTPNRRMSVDAACTIIIGKDVPVAPTCVRASSITSTSAIISWLPSNSNYQHVVCVNSVEVRMLKPGIYRHTITGLSPNTTYRVTVKVKNIKPTDDKQANRLMQVSSTSVDFRTLPKGLPDPPLDVQVEAGPQDGTLLITWLPVTINATGTSNGSQVTGYSIYADGKKVVDIDSPTGDHALLELTKLTSTPKHVTVRTKSGESVSADSIQVQVPNAMMKHSKMTNMEINKMTTMTREGDYSKEEEEDGEGEDSSEQSELSDIAEEAEDDAHDMPHTYKQQLDSRFKTYGQQNRSGMSGGKDWSKKAGDQTNNRAVKKGDVAKRKDTDMSKMPGGGKSTTSGRVHGDSRRSGSAATSSSHRRQDSLGQTVMDTEDNLSDKEVYPSSQHHVSIPAIEITKDSASEGRNSMEYSEEVDYLGHRRDRRGGGVSVGGGRGRVGQRGAYDPRTGSGGAPGNSNKRVVRDASGSHHAHHHPLSQHSQSSQQPRNVRNFVALFDYDPKTMSPNPGAFMEELPFREGQLIKIYGDKDPDGFYWGEVGNRKGYVPCNMVSQVQGGEHEESQSRRAVPPPHRDSANYRGHTGGPRGNQNRWNEDSYDMVGVKKMVALYDYDPQELSPNVDADVELSFNTGDVIYVYGDMDEDGFFMGEMNGVRGLVPSNFLAEAPADYPEESRRHISGGPDHHNMSGGGGGVGVGGPNMGGRGVYDANAPSRRTPHPSDSAKYNYHPRPGSQQQQQLQQQQMSQQQSQSQQQQPQQQRW